MKINHTVRFNLVTQQWEVWTRQYRRGWVQARWTKVGNFGSRNQAQAEVDSRNAEDRRYAAYNVAFDGMCKE
jgi:hypothetical protein